MPLREDIINAARCRGIDPYNDPFTPADLGLNASDYGSFADYCDPEDAESGQYNPNVILKVAKRKRNNRPWKYLLIS
ncbi:MAG TPA: hypothetical protein P5295_13715 [Spirochaetota bacterium]|nr:hypothetical protein [Spirochaetota bacterium]